MTLVDPVQGNQIAVPPQGITNHTSQTAQERATMRQIMDSLESMSDEVDSMHQKVDTALALKNPETANPWAGIANFFATCLRCMASVFRRNH